MLIKMINVKAHQLLIINMTDIKKIPLVAIVGRVNVGKSTLFNRLIEKRRALVSEIPGTTRDIHYGLVNWRGKKFIVADTGGLLESKLKEYEKKDKPIYYETEKKAREIIKQADLIIFLVDNKVGVLNQDRQIAKFLKIKKGPLILVANKIDQKNSSVEEFKKLGLGQAVGIAAASGVGVGDLLDLIIEKIKKIKPENSGDFLFFNNKNEEKIIKVSIIGKPNAGKSSLLNKIVGKEKAIVSAIPHTTREPQDTFLEYEKETIKIVDTAGIRRKAKVEKSFKKPTLESAGIAMSIAAMKKAEIALLTIDLTEGITEQDSKLAELTINAGLSLIIVANKYDLVEKKQKNDKIITDYIRYKLPFMIWAPIIFVSALSGKNCQKILPLIIEIKKEREKIIESKELNEFFQYLIKKMPPPRQERNIGGKKSRSFITKIEQKNADRPIFLLTAINKTKIPDSYLRYLENNLRERFKFIGTPIKIVVERTIKK